MAVQDFTHSDIQGCDLTRDMFLRRNKLLLHIWGPIKAPYSGSAILYRSVIAIGIPHFPDPSLRNPSHPRPPRQTFTQQTENTQTGDGFIVRMKALTLFCWDPICANSSAAVTKMGGLLASWGSNVACAVFA